MPKDNPRHRFSLYEDALEGSNEISVRPENEQNHYQPDVGDTILLPDMPDDHPVLTIERVEQVEDEYIYDLLLSNPLEDESPEGTSLLVKPRG